MVIIGIDAHKRSHTLVVCDAQGRKLAERTTGTSSRDHLGLLRWAARYGSERLWAVEDCRHLSRRTKRLMSDNAWTYTRNRALAELLTRNGIRHLLIPYRRPQVNGKVERFQPTLKREWALGHVYRSSETTAPRR
jgi:transposase InsO family protein